jgi:predicted phosphoribosyltransferase
MSVLDADRLFRDRAEAGRRLADRLRSYAEKPEVSVLALPRGGVPVGLEVARSLGAPLDVLVVRKLGVPGHEELAMGAISSGGIVVLNRDIVEALGISEAEIRRVEAEEKAELERREFFYRQGKTPADFAGRTVLLVDDGLATGASMRAAVQAVRRKHPKRLVIAVPVASRATAQALAREVDELVYVRAMEPFHSVGAWYDEFAQTSDEEVRRALSALRAPTGC